MNDLVKAIEENGILSNVVAEKISILKKHEHFKDDSEIIEISMVLAKNGFLTI